ncbi:MAG TPA: WYL domain-containing protein [Actinophytocola sp.]|uniref:helix-turn-helix transcriptional regulator n=1 Tax=Actinophytocola sp. TaxID=1872138 RepID=UPI002F94E9B8
MRADRLLSLILLLQAHGRLPATTLAERLEVSVRTVLRDVEALGMAGIPVYTERGRTGGIRLLEGYRSGLGGLSQTEATSLAVGQRRLTADLGLGDALDAAIEKLLGAGGHALRSGLEHGRGTVLVDVDPWLRSGESVPLLPAIHDGITRGRRLDLRYRDGDDRPRELTVDPLGLVAKAGVWYLVAREPVREASPTPEPRLLRVSRVQSCEVGPQPATRPEGFDLASAWARLRGTVEHRRRELTVTVTVAPAASGMVRRLLATKIRSDEPAHGGSVLRLSFAAVGEAVGSLLGLGTRIEVVDPPAVRAALRTAAHEVAQLYRED